MVQKHIYELYTSRELLLLIFYISQGSVVTHLRCSGENDTSLVANLLLSPTVKEFLKLANSSQSYERISSGTFFMAHGVLAVCLVITVADWAGWTTRTSNTAVKLIMIIVNLLAQKHNRVTCATKQSEQDSKDTDATNSCPRKVQIKTILWYTSKIKKSL